MQKLLANKGRILMVLIGILSIINILLSFRNDHIASDVVSVIGLIGLLLFLFKKDACRYFIWIWISAQVIIINHVFVDPLTGTTVRKSILDLSQALQIKIGFFLRSNQSAYIINLNLLTVLYFFLFRHLRTDSLIGKTFRLLIMKNNLDISFEGETYVTLVKRVNLEGDDNWLLGELNQSIVYCTQNVEKILVYTEKGYLTDTFRIIPDGIPVSSPEVSSLASFELADWMVLA